MPVYAIHDGNVVVNTIVADSKEIAEECTQLFAVESVDYKPWLGWQNYEFGWRPAQPYPSWEWNQGAEVWEAPVPLPSELGDWAWDEEDQEWVEIIPESPFPSWVWDENEHRWRAPSPYPDNSKPYRWNEETTQWELVVQ